MKTTSPTTDDGGRPVDTERLRSALQKKSGQMKLGLSACAGCSLCAESCFMFRSHGRDPRYMPSYKVLNSLGRLYRKNGRVSRTQLEEMKTLLWGNCVLCGRCYCPIGIDLPRMIAFGRSILRSQGLYGVYPHSLGAPPGDGPPPSAAPDLPGTEPGTGPARTSEDRQVLSTTANGANRA